MQLPPTIMSIDKGKKDKKSLPSSAAKPSTKSGTKKQASILETEREKAPETEAESGDEDAQSDEDEGDPELVAEPEEPSKLTPRNLQNAGSKTVLRPPRTLETTLFERLEKMYGPGIKRMLTVQYRLVNTSLS